MAETKTRVGIELPGQLKTDKVFFLNSNGISLQLDASDTIDFLLSNKGCSKKEHVISRKGF